MPGSAQVGVTTHEPVGLRGMTFRSDATSTASRPDACLEWRAAEHQQQLQGSRRVAPAGQMGCRFPEMVEGRLLGVVRPLPLGPLVAWLLERQRGPDLRRLHLLPEAPTSGPTREGTATEPLGDGAADDPPGDGPSESGRHQPDAEQSSRAQFLRNHPGGGSSRPAGLAPAAPEDGVDAGPRRPGQGQGPPQAVPQGRHAPLTRPGRGVGAGRVAATTAAPRPGAGARSGVGTAGEAVPGPHSRDPSWLLASAGRV